MGSLRQDAINVQHSVKACNQHLFNRMLQKHNALSMALHLHSRLQELDDLSHSASNLQVQPSLRAASRMGQMQAKRILWTS